MDDEVPISVEAWKPKVRECSFVKELVFAWKIELRGIIIQSGNDASVAVAEYLSGTEDAFADLMNAQAQALGMSSTGYRNSTGLPAEGPSHDGSGSCDPGAPDHL